MGVHRHWIAILLVAILSACASFSDFRAEHYDRRDTPESQFIKDSTACELEGEKNRSTGGMGGLAGVASYHETFNRVFDACMRSKGYARKAK